jgi:hypothetical protein
MTNIDSAGYAAQFEQSFVKALSTFRPEDFINAWASCNQRTSFYEKNLFPRIADLMELKLTNELFRVDYLLHKYVEGVRIPIVAVESENYASKTYEEMQKLIALSSPVKVLITCASWSTDEQINCEQSMKGEVLPIWNKYLNIAHAEGALHGSFLFYVSEWGDDGFVRYYSYHSIGNVINEHGEVFKIRVDK